MDSEGMHVVVVPLFAQSHLNQLLHFCTGMATRKGVSVSFVASSTHVQQVRIRFQGTRELHNISFEGLEMADDLTEDAEQPSVNGESTRHMFPMHLSPLFDCGDILRPQMDAFLRKLRSSNHNKLVIMVYDMHMAWVQPLADKHEIPAYKFIPVGIYSALWFHHKLSGPEMAGSGSGLGLGLSSLKVPLLRTVSEEHLRFLDRQRKLVGSEKGTIVSSLGAIESRWIELAEEMKVFGDEPVWTVGPLLPRQFFSEEETQMEYCECRKWLDGQSEASVLYVSFGSVSSLPAAQIRELAVGLERSGVPFLWVLRPSDTSRYSPEGDSMNAMICEFLPEGYEDGVEGRGVIVRKWAPQVEILFHKSTGGFLTHCGWNSTVESMCAGVPIVAWPLHSDQFANAKLVSCELKAGVEVKEWSCSEEYEMVSAEEIEMAVKRLMVSEEGVEMRKRAMDLRALTRNGFASNSSTQFDSLINHFAQTAKERV